MSQLASDAKISSAMSNLGMTAPLPNLDDSQVLKALLVALGNITTGGGGGGSGTVTSVAASVPAFLSVSGSPITTAGTLAIGLSGTPLPVANGGTGTATPAIVAGTNVTVSGTWPNQTINSTASGTGDVVGPASATDGVPALFDSTTGKLLKNSTPTGTGNPVLATSPTLVTPNLGVPTAIDASAATGTAASLTAGQATAALGLKTASTTVAISSATAPTAGQVLTAINGTSADWETPSGGLGFYRTKNILASEFIPRVTNGSLVNSSETATNDVNYDTTDFDPATTQYAQYWWKTPLEWDAGTIKAKISWAADSGSGDVVWNVSAVAIGDGEALDSAQGTAIAVTDTLQSADLNESPATAAITPGGTPVAGKYLVIEVSRDSASGTLATNARLLGVDIQYKESTTPPSSW